MIQKANNKTFSIEQIEFDMWKRAREIWQAKDLPIESFDPLVKLLIGACAVEVKKIADEIQSSRSRVLQRLAQVMMPDMLAGPIPASTVLQVRPAEPSMLISPELQASYSKDGVDFFFSPAGHYKIIDATVEVSHVLLSDKLIDITERTLPSKKAVPSKSLELTGQEQLSLSNARTLLLAVDVNEQVQSLDGLTFFFDWTHVPPQKRAEYCKLLQSTRWTINGNQLKTHAGISPHQQNNGETARHDFELSEEFDISALVEKRVNDYYKHHFVTLELPKNVQSIESLKQACPESLSQRYAGQDIPYTKPLLWFEIQFPAAFPDVALEQQLSHTLINCVPAINRKLNTKRHLLYDRNLNIIPLEIDEQFFSIMNVLDSNGKPYKNMQSFDDSAGDSGGYYLRHGGVSRIDSRKGVELVAQLQDVIRDESTAFAAINPDELVSDLNTLKQSLARIDKNISQSESQLESTWYLVLNQEKNQDTSWEETIVKFWSTQGAKANDMAPGTINQVVSVDYGPAVSDITNVTATISGRDRLREADLVHAYRSQIITRGRVVTAEDIRSFCFAYLGSQIERVEIDKGVMVGSSPTNGLVRTLEVILTPSGASKLTGEEWQQMCHEMKTLLESNWTGSLPILVFMQESEAGNGGIELE